MSKNIENTTTTTTTMENTNFNYIMDNLKNYLDNMNEDDKQQKTDYNDYYNTNKYNYILNR